MTAKFLIIITFGLLLMPSDGFKEDQLKYSRVKDAFSEKQEELEHALREKGISGEYELFIQAFKRENVLEVWAKADNSNHFTCIKEYEFCQSKNRTPANEFGRDTSNTGQRLPELKERPLRIGRVEGDTTLITGFLGPKRKQGDLQIPEGLYYINHFNHLSDFHLSLGINYPNRSDRILGDPVDPGDAIYIHGGCSSAGCIPLTDDRVKELYVLAVEARNAGQKKIPVYIFPVMLTDPKMQELKNEFKEDATKIAFWKELAPFYQYFAEHKSLPGFSINDSGAYVLKSGG